MQLLCYKKAKMCDCNQLAIKESFTGTFEGRLVSNVSNDYITQFNH